MIESSICLKFLKADCPSLSFAHTSHFLLSLLLFPWKGLEAETDNLGFFLFRSPLPPPLLLHLVLLPDSCLCYWRLGLRRAE